MPRKFTLALGLLSSLAPFVFRLGAVEEGSGGGEAKPAPEAGGGEAKALSASDFMAKLTAAFRAKESLAKENSELKARVTAAETARDEARAAQTAAETARTSAESARAAAEAGLATAQASLAAVATALGMKPEELSGKSAAEVQQAFSARIEARSGERLAELGFPAAGLPSAAQTGSAASGDELADIQEQLKTERDPVRAGQLAARANQLRDAKWGVAPGKN